MAEEIKVTYEALFEILRREKNREELQPLSPSFLDDVSAYIQKKKEIMKQQESTLNVFSANERDKANIQLTNIKRILKELYDRREKKIIGMALIKSRSRSNIVDISALLPQEEHLLTTLTGSLAKSRAELLLYMLEKENALQTQIESPNLTAQKDEEPTASVSVNIAPKPEKTPPDSVKVRLLEAITKFVGPDLEIYGPYIANDKAELPSQIAEILINKGKAERTKQENLVNA